jgi:hypothetical protein
MQRKESYYPESRYVKNPLFSLGGAGLNGDDCVCGEVNAVTNVNLTV